MTDQHRVLPHARTLATLGLVVCLLIFTLPGTAFAAAVWANQCPARSATYHVQFNALYVDVYGSTVNKSTAYISLDHGPNKLMTVAAKSANGHWDLSEVLQPDGFTWKATWAWVADNPALGSTKVALSYAMPAALGDGWHLANVSAKDQSSPANVLSTSWWFEIEVPPTIGSQVVPAKDAIVTTATPVVSCTTSDNSYVDYVEYWIDGVYIGGAMVSAPSGTASKVVGPLANGPHTVRLQAFDGNGNEFDKTWMFNVAVP